jgi:phospholipid-translocating ATPase
VDDITFVGILEVLLLWMVLYNYIIPLSLYVSLEFQKFVSSMQFVWDEQMYDPDTDEAAQGSN